MVAMVVVAMVVVYVCMSVCLCLPVAACVRTVGSNGVARLGSLSLGATCGHHQHSSGLQWSNTGFLDNTSLAF